MVCRPIQFFLFFFIQKTNAFKFECLSYSDGEGGGRTRGPDREAEDQSVQGGATVGRGEHAYGQVMEW